MGGFIPFGQGRVGLTPRTLGYPTFTRTKQISVVKQYASFLFPVPEVFGLLIEWNVLRVGVKNVSEYITMRGGGGAYTAATGYPFPRPISRRHNSLGT